MKINRLLPLFTFCFFAFKLISQEGISFKHNGEWDAAIAQAKAENKLIFIDAFTTWCGPCKMMSNNIFPNPQVSKFYNEKFVNVKMDMEKGEGVELAKKFEVIAYPTLLFVDPTTTSIVHRTAGYMAVDEFIQLGKNAQDPTKRMSSMDNRYKKGDRDPDFLYNYAMAKMASYDGSANAVGEEYLKTQTDWKTERNLKFVFDIANNSNSEAFRFLCKNQAIFQQKFGQEAILGKIEQVISQDFQARPDMNLTEINKIFKDAYPEKGDEMASRYAMTFHRQRGDREGFSNSAIKHYKKYPTKNPEELNEIAWTFYQVVEDPAALKTAVKWAKKATKIAPSFFNFDTLASLNFKLKNKKAAQKAAQKAIDLGRASGEDFAPTEELLKKIQAL
jgi:thiol-disulfide isomerase/thioredoxin